MNRVFLLGIVVTAPRSIESRSGAIQAFVDFETREDEIDERSGASFARKQPHQLVFSGKLAANIQAVALVGRELSIEGKLSYWKSGAVIRVSSVKAIETNVTNATQKMVSSSQENDLAFLNSPAISRFATRGS